MTNDLLTRKLIEKSIIALKSTDRKGLSFIRYNNPIIFQELMMIDINDIKGQLQAIYKLFMCLGSTGIMETYMIKQYIDKPLGLYMEYLGQCSSYKSNFSFVMKIFNKLLHIVLWKMFTNLEETKHTIDLDKITNRKLKHFLTYGRDLSDSIYVDSKQLDELISSILITSMRDTHKATVKMNMGDFANDWVKINYKVGRRIINSKVSLIQSKTVDLEKLFIMITSESQNKWIQHLIMKKAALKLREELHNDMTNVMYRHTLIWLLKSIIFSDKVLKPAPILKNFDFYWKHSELLELLFIEYYNETGRSGLMDKRREDQTKTTQDIHDEIAGIPGMIGVITKEQLIDKNKQLIIDKKKQPIKK